MRPWPACRLKTAHEPDYRPFTVLIVCIVYVIVSSCLVRGPVVRLWIRWQASQAFGRFALRSPRQRGRLPRRRPAHARSAPRRRSLRRAADEGSAAGGCDSRCSWPFRVTIHLACVQVRRCESNRRCQRCAACPAARWPRASPSPSRTVRSRTSARPTAVSSTSRSKITLAVSPTVCRTGPKSDEQQLEPVAAEIEHRTAAGL